MLQMIQHMIAGILASATIVGGGGVTVTEIVTPPGSVDPQNPPGLAEFIEMVPDAARIDCSVIQNRTARIGTSRSALRRMMRTAT